MFADETAGDRVGNFRLPQASRVSGDNPAQYAGCTQLCGAFKVTDLACVKNFSGGLLWLVEKLKMTAAWRAEQRGTASGRPTILGRGCAIAASNKDSYRKNLL